MPVVYARETDIQKELSHQSESEMWELMLILSGGGQLICGDTAYDVQPGEIFCIPEKTPRQITGGGRITALLVRSSEVFVTKKREVLLLEDESGGSLKKTLALICEQLGSGRENSANIVGALFEAAQYMILACCDSGRKSRNVELLEKLLCDNFTNPEYNISDAVATMPFCSDYIRRQFKSETGVTPIVYLSGLRLEHAKKLLRHENRARYTIAEVSFMCGFYDPRYFSRLFKKYTGKTPSEYAGL